MKNGEIEQLKMTSCDVYDGQMWEHFEFDCMGEPFLANSMDFLIILNCDWFQPFKHTQYSVGVLYLAVANLPRHIRFCRENIMVVGIIPGPSEPSKNINSYLDPLATDLKQLWTGVTVKINGRPTAIRAALYCLACFVPAIGVATGGPYRALARSKKLCWGCNHSY